MQPSWTTPDAIRQQLQRLWDKGDWLASHVTGEPLFPRELRLKRPGAKDIADRFMEVRDWVRTLRDGSREQRGLGYDITWERVNHRVHGSNDLPAGITVPTEADGLRLIGRTRELARFQELARETLRRHPALKDWLARRPLTALERADEWPGILAILDHFTAHPRPGVYLRQLDIPGVDTKFIGNRRKLLGELLDQVLPEAAIDATATGAARFEQRYGLRDKPVLVRFRALDAALNVGPFSDLTVPVEELAAWRPPVRHVFITENEINGLAFPDCPGGLVIFGLGYGLDRLADIPWLHEAAVHYWGDIDTHGFAMLSRLRQHVTHTRSLLMDRETLDTHHGLWGEEATHQRFTGELLHLTPEEHTLFTALRENTIGERIRLEQERIGYTHVCEAVTGRTL
ncbi:Wadjet anti-phage system protein JetD domain-containing protein [Aquisalimonas sp. APHAB1-3]|uniref:Wadjet anti-phage system protein JetD domain-containing protein n=1 Tax=Aquisalimonas sp. APHAB1-3 TaxID=3402080 RepID=UPI003AB054B6